jgi:hypothetical protein
MTVGIVVFHKQEPVWVKRGSTLHMAIYDNVVYNPNIHGQQELNLDNLDEGNVYVQVRCASTNQNCFVEHSSITKVTDEGRVRRPANHYEPFAVASQAVARSS